MQSQIVVETRIIANVHMKEHIKTQINLNKSIYMIVYLTYDKLSQADAILQTFFTLTNKSTRNNKAILAFVIPF